MVNILTILLNTHKDIFQMVSQKLYDEINKYFINTNFSNEMRWFGFWFLQQNIVFRYLCIFCALERNRCVIPCVHIMKIIDTIARVRVCEQNEI